MIVLDENITNQQRIELRRLGIHFCQIGGEVGHKGMQDDQVIPLLRTMRKPTFVSWDGDYYNRALSSDSFCLAHLDVRPAEAAQYIRRLLRHPGFRTWSQRQGCVLRVSASGISGWQTRHTKVNRWRWVD